MLEVDDGSALLLIERTARCDWQPIEYARDLFRPDQVRISVQTVAGESGALLGDRLFESDLCGNVSLRSPSL